MRRSNLRRLDHQVEVVGHQTVGVDLKTGFLTRLRQGLEKILAVGLVPKDRLPAVPSAEDVVDGPFIFDSDLPWHERMLAKTSQGVKPCCYKTIV
jgi:hypothetical protein